MRKLHEPSGLDSLTENQRQLLRLYVEEGSYKRVAHRMGKNSVNTVRATAQLIFRRLGASSITEACILLDRAER